MAQSDDSDQEYIPTGADGIDDEDQDFEQGGDDDYDYDQDADDDDTSDNDELGNLGDIVLSPCGLPFSRVTLTEYGTVRFKQTSKSETMERQILQP